MDARERLRRYLEQRRELGERELVLDELSVEDAMRLLGAGPATHAVVATTTPPTAASSLAAPPHDTAAPVAESTSEEPMPARRTKDSSSTPVAPAAPAAPAAPVAPAVPAVPAASGSPATATIGRLASLDAVAEATRGCTRCPLYETASNAVPGEGNPNAGLMVVGEAPGQNEDESGRPFVGAAGQLLTKILEAIKLRREDVFIANVLKHRPPGNRNPKPDEVAACSPYLVRQIELVKPKVILALGTFAAQTLLDTKLAIGKLRGQEHRYHGVPLVVTYHPAALLRNPAWKRPTWEDVQLARRILDSSSTGA